MVATKSMYIFVGDWRRKPAVTDLELMQAHCDACYVQDAAAELVCVNDWIKRAAPAFWLGVTRQGLSWRFRFDVPAEVRARAERLIGSEPFADGERQRPIHDAMYREIFATQQAVAGPTYILPCRAVSVGSQTTPISEANRELLRDGLEAWIPDIAYQQPMVVSLAEGRAVSVCASVRITPTAHEAGVETVGDHRRRGHAVAAVRAWAREVEAGGALPLYSTSWDNHASRAVAARVGGELFGWEYRVG
jgi:hypothetical protein